MKVKVIKKSNQDFWYDNRVGEIFECEKLVWNDPWKQYSYSVIDSDGSFISQNDGEEVQPVILYNVYIYNKDGSKQIVYNNIPKWSYGGSVEQGTGFYPYLEGTDSGIEVFIDGHRLKYYGFPYIIEEIPQIIES